MISDATARQVIHAIARVKKVDPASITPDTTLEDLNMDSLDGLNLFYELEEALDMDIPDEAARSMRTVHQIVEGLKLIMSEKEAAHSDGSIQK
jgi:acyl carrier protein